MFVSPFFSVAFAQEDYSLTIRVSLDSKIALSGEIITLTIRAINETDPVNNVTINFASNQGGNFIPSQGYTNLTGYLQAIFEVPYTLEPLNVTVSILASRIGFTEVERNISILVLPPLEIGSLDVSVTSENLTISSGHSTNLHVDVTDGSNPVSNASVCLHCEGGAFSPGGGITDSLGHITFTYVSPETAMSVTLIINVTASKPGYRAARSSIQITVIPPILMHHVEISEISLPSYGLINQKLALKVKVRNPSELDVNASVKVIAFNISTFPSSTISQVVSPTRTTYQALESFLFHVTFLTVGEQSIEVQLWQNETMVDSDLLIFTVFNSMDPMLRSFWVWYIVGGFTYLLYTFAIITLFKPDIRWERRINTTTGPVLIGKGTLALILTCIFGLVGFLLASHIPSYYYMIPYFIPLVGTINPIIGIAVFLSAFAWIFRIHRSYYVSSAIADTLLILVIFSLVWNALLIPTFPFTLSQSILIQVIVTVSLKSLFIFLERRWRPKK